MKKMKSASAASVVVMLVLASASFGMRRHSGVPLSLSLPDRSPAAEPTPRTIDTFLTHVRDLVDNKKEEPEPKMPGQPQLQKPRPFALLDHGGECAECRILRGGAPESFSPIEHLSSSSGLVADKLNGTTWRDPNENTQTIEDLNHLRQLKDLVGENNALNLGLGRDHRPLGATGGTRSFTLGFEHSFSTDN